VFSSIFFFSFLQILIDVESLFHQVLKDNKLFGVYDRLKKLKFYLFFYFKLIFFNIFIYLYQKYFFKIKKNIILIYFFKKKLLKTPRSCRSFSP
jgi:hypothetical protein